MDSPQFLRVTTNYSGFWDSYSNSYLASIDTPEAFSNDVTHNPNRVAVLTNNPLSYYWKGRVTAVLPLYISGMVGYACSLIVRLVELVKYIFDLIFDPFLDDRPYMEVFSEKFVSLMAGFGSIGSALIGMVIPPLAYKIDEWIQSNYSVYKNHLTQWMTVPKDLIDAPIDNFLALWQGGDVNARNRMGELENQAKAIYTHYFVEAARQFGFTVDEISDPSGMQVLRKMACVLCVLSSEHADKILTCLTHSAINLNIHRKYLQDNSRNLIVRNGDEISLSDQIPDDLMTTLTNLDGRITTLRQFDTHCLRAATQAVQARKESWGRFLLRFLLPV